jgi:hypothetical protein
MGEQKHHRRDMQEISSKVPKSHYKEIILGTTFHLHATNGLTVPSLRI